MKLEVMAKFVKVGDVLVKGAHKYTVVQVEKVMHTDLVVIAYKTLKTETIRTMQVAATEFVKVIQNEEPAADQVEAMDEEQYRKAIINGEVKGDWYVWLRKKLNIDRSKFPMDHDLEKEAYRICVDVYAEGNEEEGAGYFDNLNDEYGDIETARSKRESFEVAAEVNEVFKNDELPLADEPAADPKNFYIDLCEQEIKRFEEMLADEVDEDHKAFLKDRIENRKIELEFLKTGKQPVQEKTIDHIVTNNEDPLSNLTTVEVDQFEVNNLVGSYLQWETLEKIAEQKGDEEGKYKCNANKWAIADRAGNVDVHFANAFAKELEKRRNLS